MNNLSKALACALISAGAVVAQLPMPGSVLVFPSLRNDATTLTLVSVTNTAGTPITGDVLAYFNYVNATANPNDLFRPQSCDHFCRAEYLTANDTVTVSVGCHSPFAATRGYLVVWPQSPTTGARISHNYLAGSVAILDFLSNTYFSYSAAPFCSPKPAGAPTDMNNNGRLDFNGMEYESMHCDLIVDSFIGASNSRLALAEFSGLGFGAEVALSMSIWNDNENPLSLHFNFQCFFETEFDRISSLFTEAWLRGVPNDPGEFDFNCDGIGDLETGWLRIRADQATLGHQVVINPPLMGVLVGGPRSCSDSRLLWGSKERCSGVFH